MAEKLLGYSKSPLWGAAPMMAGSLILAVDPVKYFFVGISCNIIGTGFYKPNITSMVGSLYTKNDAKRSAGFGLLFAGINTGSLLGVTF